MGRMGFWALVLAVAGARLVALGFVAACAAVVAIEIVRGLT